MSTFTQQKLIEDKPKKPFVFPQPERIAEQVEEIDISDQNIVIPNYSNCLLSLTLNRSSQQTSKKYDTTNVQHSRNVKEQMKNEYFVMSDRPCNLSNDSKIYLSIGENGVLKKVRYTFKNCNSWRCPKCAPKKAIALSHQISEMAVINNLSYYLTLTLDPNNLSPEEIFGGTHKLITKLINHFFTIMKRKKFSYFNEKKQKWYVFDLKNNEERLKYIWVIEFQKNGLAHMHILLNQFLPIQIVRKVWKHIGGGHIMNIQKARSPQAVANYITKYIVKEFNGKNPNPRTFRFFERRYSISRSCVRPPKYSQSMFSKETTNYDIQIKLNELKLGWLYDKLGESQNFSNF